MSSNFDSHRQSHIASDVDQSPGSQHHTLGTGNFQASPGNHNHDKVYQPVGNYQAAGNYQVVDDTGWVNITTFNAPYKSYDAGTFQTKYRKLNGIVYIEGLVDKSDLTNFASGVSVTVCPPGTLPTTIRPTLTLYRAVPMAASSGGCRLLLGNDGSLVVLPGAATPWVGLSCSYYRGA